MACNAEVRRRQRGFTVVEIMVAMAIGLVVSAVVVTMFAASSRSYRVTDAMGDMQESGRIAMSTLQRDARVVGFRGCNSNNVANSAPITNVQTTPTVYLNNFIAGVEGFEASAGAWTPVLPTAVSAPGAPVAAGPTALTDVLVMRVAAGTPVALAANMANVTSNIPLMSVANFANGTRAIVSDCVRATVFRVTGVNAGAKTLAHALSAGNNSTGSVLRAFGIDASVMRYETHAYFVGPSIRDAVNERSLWVRVDGNAPVEVVENVQDMQILYGEDTDGDFVANLFRRADTVVSWNNVQAIQVSLLLRGSGLGDNQVITNYVFDGATVTPTDRRLRRTYTATIQLRNRTL
jgi:type IV pilus assembly protein PilW